MTNIEEAIRERAYKLWADSGYHHGNAEAHWLAAQREILAASLSSIAHVTAAKPVVLAALKQAPPVAKPKKKRRAA